MRILGLVESTDHVCCRYRLRAFADGLARSGHQLELQPLGRGLSRWKTLGNVGAWDAVILQRRLLSFLELSRLRRYAKLLIFDFDDAVFLRDSYHPRGGVSTKLACRFASTVKAADIVVAGNDWLADNARFNGARHDVVIPTCMDHSIYPIARHQSSSQLTCVWIGSSSTLNGIERQRDLLEQIGRVIPNLTLRLVCDRSIQLAHWHVDHRPWSESTEASALATADVGLSLLPDDDWSRGKCGLKVLQYLAAGLPIVGNSVGVTAEMINGAGIVADSLSQWIGALEQLRNPLHRRELAAVGRCRVARDYSIAAGLSRWLGVISECTAQRRAG